MLCLFPDAYLSPQTGVEQHLTNKSIDLQENSLKNKNKAAVKQSQRVNGGFIDRLEIHITVLKLAESIFT